MWNDAKFRRLSAPEPNAQTLWMRLLTGPELTAIPGLIPTGEAGMAEALGWSLKAFREAFREVFREGLAEADYQARLIFVPGAIQYNAPASPNVVLAWAETWDELPECELKDKAHAHLHDFLSSIGDKWLEAFEEACGKPSPKPYGKPYGKACPNQEQEQEQEIKRDTSYLLSIRDPNGPPA
ncbi:MAG TPA: hypothetical protein ENJ50_06760, partial [Planctomycetaceae bacterium]|nr:hypothetical protein [Planctomycetaceae bacterium]